MKRQLTLLGALAAVICFAQSAAAQELVRVYSPQSYRLCRHDDELRLWSRAGLPDEQLCSGDDDLLRAGGVVPTTTYYAPAGRADDHLLRAGGCADDDLLRSGRRADHDLLCSGSRADHGLLCSGVVPYYGRAYYYAPAPLVPGQPVRNAFRAMTW